MDGVCFEAGMAESTKTAGGHFGVIKSSDGKQIIFECQLKTCDDTASCTYKGTLFYNHGVNLSGRGTGIHHGPMCNKASKQVVGSTTAAVKGPYKQNGHLVGREGSQAEFEKMYPKP